MVADGKIISFREVSSHNTVNDCWVIINAKAYNVTNFLSEHPGGDEVLLAFAGKDASQEFEDAGHGSAARLMLDEFYIGEIDPPTSCSETLAATTTPPPNQPVDDDNRSRPESGFAVKLVQYLFAPLAILGLDAAAASGIKLSA